MSLIRRRARSFAQWSGLMLIMGAIALVGCDSGGPGTGKTVTAPPPDTVADDGHDHAGHDHPSEGPHHGDLVELGNEEYHAEVVHGEAGSVTIYVLDGAAKSAVPIDSPDVTINVTHDGKPEQFKLTAAPETGEPQGKSSKFSLVDQELANHLDEEGSAAKLVLTISGKQYTGKIEHHHGHDHDHDHK